ncbi:hypothetical protein AYW79_01305 [Ferroacidibacillus organovorans]|uniref:Uncharacterized protein n=1 Tax=Ferroacidibacillus organovorans TaxID=1765683 RepID=A0A162U167_9BACL|nr:hypothetical protein AYJ22_00705 [Ferroacidibacillus organovorans]OAG95106.1 hypothetical protein AYW79_01305 [Ferroacidibacillus organovorans]OPG15097.1 hypothetical protein B2M26_13160 [Ferroacidibacillus organovorans]
MSHTSLWIKRSSHADSLKKRFINGSMIQQTYHEFLTVNTIVNWEHLPLNYTLTDHIDLPAHLGIKKPSPRLIFSTIFVYHIDIQKVAR